MRSVVEGCLLSVDDVAMRGSFHWWDEDTLMLLVTRVGFHWRDEGQMTACGHAL